MADLGQGDIMVSSEGDSLDIEVTLTNSSHQPVTQVPSH